MYKRISFLHLPFEPLSKQVIYFEPLFDNEANAIILDNYSDIVEAFNVHGLQFVYMPKVANDKYLEKKIRYYAPYLMSEIKDKLSVQSSTLAKYISDKSENTILEPSLLFGPEKNDDGWTFSAIPFEFDTTPAKRNLWDKLLSKHREDWSSRDFRRKAFDEIAKEIKRHLHNNSAIYQEQKPSIPTKKLVDAPESGGNVKYSIRRSNPNRRGSSFWQLPNPFDGVMLSLEEDDDIQDALRQKLDEERQKKEEEARRQSEENKLRHEELTEYNKDMEELRDVVNRLRMRGVSLMAIHEFIDKNEPLSRMIITNDYRIILPDYGNIEIKMGALPKALFFLFLIHDEGIVIKDIQNYTNELFSIYRQFRPNTDEDKLRNSVERVCNPLNNNVNENISRVQAAFCKLFDEHLAKNYFITGERSELYRITLDRKLVVWED